MEKFSKNSLLFFDFILLYLLYSLKQSKEDVYDEISKGFS